MEVEDSSSPTKSQVFLSVFYVPIILLSGVYVGKRGSMHLYMHRILPLPKEKCTVSQKQKPILRGSLDSVLVKDWKSLTGER